MTDRAGEQVQVTVIDGQNCVSLSVPKGANLRDVLVGNDRSPYTRYTRTLNCGGRGLCATCGVRIEEGPPPDHWHDSLAERFGYPRLSCQVSVERDLTVRLLPDKRVWGGRE
jgi:ferredoxin